MPRKHQLNGATWAVKSSGLLPTNWYRDEVLAEMVRSEVVSYLRAGYTGYDTARRVGVSSRTVERIKKQGLRGDA